LQPLAACFVDSFVGLVDSGYSDNPRIMDDEIEAGILHSRNDSVPGIRSLVIEPLADRRNPSSQKEVGG
jgi:hypothetical protein